jgi:replicative DNA helicase
MMAVETISASLSNVEAEKALIGALMTDNRQIDAVADILDAQDFADSTFAAIYSVIVQQYSAGRPVNPVTLRPFFDGYIDFLAQLTGQIFGPARGYADQVAALAARRRLIGSLNDTIALAADPATSVEALIDCADSGIFEATHKGDPLHQPSGAQCLDEIIDGFDAPVRGTLCHSIPALDQLMGPLCPKQLVIGAGRPGMGKTALAISYAIGAAKAGHGVLFVSLEMSSTELGQRMAADMCFGRDSGIPFEDIRDSRLSETQRREICRARETMDKMPFHVVDAGSLSIGRLAMIVRRYKRRFAAKGHSLDLVIVDYLQLLTGDTKGRSNYETVSEVSRGLKAIAKDQEVAVFALAQLSREVEKRPDKRPQLSDLRDSGQIEQDADKVLFLFRLEYYLRANEPEIGTAERIEWEQALQACENRIDFMLPKRRNGRTGAAQGYFFGQFQAVRG